MYIITGGAGMIGSALLWQLNKRGVTDILVVDNLASTEKWKNLVKAQYLTYMHRERFLECIKNDSLEEALELEFNHRRGFGKIQGIVHLGACSSTTEKDADFLMQNNLEYSKTLCDYALTRGIRYIQASSAATYGDGAQGFDDDIEQLETLNPLNMYGYSKHLFDLWANRTGRLASIASIKFFNVYGPNEYHKGGMRSMVHRAVEQILTPQAGKFLKGGKNANEYGAVRLFRSYRPEYADGGQVRDFVYLKDCAEVLDSLLQSPDANGIFNLGTGQARSWNDLANAVFKAMNLEPKIEYIDMPDILRGKYQYFTEAKMERLKNALKGERYVEIRSLEDGVADYVQNHLLKDDQYL
ncbi:ADP-glyceromanno-heptose 6-epimerase [Desulfovibrio sp. OttesenSCG-928-F07]|nr:ADP-glyceromanno-heptose 6-epimerase [Desulfovibrio sp. OttesenSCG-928-F07]